MKRRSPDEIEMPPISSPHSGMRAEREITPEAFNEFLAWLHADREEAGRLYESIRRRLIKILVCRGCCCPEELVDETINRVIVKLPRIREGYRGEPGNYFGGVARHVFQEYSRRSPAVFIPEPDPTDERALACLDECLEELSGSSRDLVLHYYTGRGYSRIRARSNLARELGLEPNALRIRVHRVRCALRRCVVDCVAGG